MLKYIFKRLLQTILMLLVLSFVVFFMVRLIPGDPVEIMLGTNVPKDTLELERERLGLNDSLLVQYGNFLRNALKGDLGTSIFSNKPVLEELAQRFPRTLILAVGGTVIAAVVGVVLGIISAVHQSKFWDNLIMVLSLVAVSTPSFFLALILMLIFGVYLQWLPTMSLRFTWQAAILPMVTLGVQAVGSISGIGRYVVDAVGNRDYPAVQGSVLVLAATFVVVNTVIDLLYSAVDPQAKFE